MKLNDIMIRSIEFSINSETISILSGACYSVQDKGRFSLHNDISYPDYPSPKLFEDRSKDKLLKDSKLRSVIKEKFWRTRNVTNRVLVFVDVMEHSGGVLGNNMIFGRDNSVVVGLPYAWMGSHTEVFINSETYNYNRERFIGTIGKISSNFQQSNNLMVPQPHEHNEVVKKGGAVWGGTFEEPSDAKEFETCQFSTRSNPVKNFYTGTSITKGMPNIINHIKQMISIFYFSLLSNHPNEFSYLQEIFSRASVRALL